MPLYEFHCLKCEKDFEKLVPSSSREVHCPDCGTPEIEKKFSTFGIKSGSSFSSSMGGGNCGSCTASSCSSCH